MKDYKDYESFIFFGGWRDTLEGVEKELGKEYAQELLWNIMIAGTTGEIKSDDPFIFGYIKGTILPLLSKLRNRKKYTTGPSKGEQVIAATLDELKIKYIQEYPISLLGPKGQNRRMDFAIIDKENKIICFIEYQGIQHYKENNYFNSSLKEVQEVDEEKREWCKKQNIPLIEIPYWDLCRIDAEYLNKLIKNL